MINEILEISKTRIKNTLFCYYILGWLLLNYKIPMILLFSERKIEAKIIYLENINLSIKDWLLYPLTLALGLIFTHRILFTWSSYIIDLLISRFVDDKIKKNNYKKMAKDIQNKKEIKKAELQVSDEFLKKEIDIDHKQKERDIQKQQEQNELPEVKEQVINHIDISKVNKGYNSNLTTIKEYTEGPKYRFSKNNISIHTNEDIDISVTTYRELSKGEVLVLNISNAKIDKNIEFNISPATKNIYKINSYINLEMLGKYKASIKILNNHDIIDTAIFILTVNKQNEPF